MDGHWRYWRFIFTLLCFFSLLTAYSVPAQTLIPAGVIEYEDAEIFRPTTDSGDYLTVYDSDTLAPGNFSLGFYGDYANDPIEIRDENGDRFSRLVRDLGTMQFMGSVGLFPSLQLGVRVPGYIAGFQDILSVGGARFKGTELNLGDVVANAKFTLLPRSRYGIGIAILPELTLPTGNRREYAGTGKFGFGGFVVLDAEPVQNLRLSLNLGGVGRSEVSDQLRGGLGLTYLFSPRVAAIVESYAATSTKRAFKEEFTTPTDVIGALRFGLGPVDLTLGGGAGVTNGRGSPDFRAFVGITTPKSRLVAEQPMLAGPNLARSQKTYALINRDEDVRPTPGDRLEYRILLVNSGDQPATNVVVEDVIPAGAVYVPGSAAVRGQPVTDAADGDAGEFVAAPPKMMFRLSSLDNRPGSNEALLTFQVDIGNVTQPVNIMNRAIIRADRIPEFPLTSEVAAYPRLKQVVVTPDRLVIKSNIHFEFDRNEVRSDSYPVLDEIVSVLNTYPDLRIRIEGHTDAVGTKQYNAGLSDRRATAVRRFLVGRGVSADRIEWVGRGEGDPVGDNVTPIGRAKNRRMEFRVLNPEALKLDQKATEVRVEPTPYEPDLALESEPAWLQGKDISTPAMRRRARLDE